MTKLKLFIWPEFLPSYSSGLAFAIAETEEEAREMVIIDTGLDYLRNKENTDRFGILIVNPISKKCAYSVTGAD